MVPPRKPRGESAKVTIAMQDKQISMLVNRVEQLLKERDIWKHDCNQAEEVADNVQHQLKGLDHILRSTEAAHTRLLGWQDCAREILQSKSTGE
jgi:mannitol-1-phosphate/altronate dehydrogenase